MVCDAMIFGGRFSRLGNRNNNGQHARSLCAELHRMTWPAVDYSPPPPPPPPPASKKRGGSAAMPSQPLLIVGEHKIPYVRNFNSVLWSCDSTRHLKSLLDLDLGDLKALRPRAIIARPGEMRSKYNCAVCAWGNLSYYILGQREKKNSRSHTIAVRKRTVVLIRLNFTSIHTGIYRRGTLCAHCGHIIYIFKIVGQMHIY